MSYKPYRRSRERTRHRNSYKRTTSRRRPSYEAKGRVRSVERVINPMTGRWMTVGGGAYQDALAHGYTRRDMQRKGTSTRIAPHRRYSSSAGRSASQLGETLRMPVSRRSRTSITGRGGGYRTRGWGEDAPHRGTERHELRKRCGDKCFLDPEHEAFPICARLGSSGGRDCQIDCRGVRAARVRSGQWGYTRIGKSVDRLVRDKCSK